jgi:putative flippase GtrA
MTYFDRLFRLLVASARGFSGLFIRHQFLRFLLIGIGNTVFSYGAYAALIFVGFEYRVASLLALLLGIAFSFTTQGTVVFRNATRVTLVKFVAAWALLYLFNIALIALFMSASMNAYLAGAVATAPVTLVSYFVLKFAVFGRSKTNQPATSTE